MMRQPGLLLFAFALCIVAPVVLMTGVQGRYVVARPGNARVLALPRALPLAQATPDSMQVRRDILADPDIQQRSVTPAALPTPSLPDIDLSFMRWVFIGLGVIAFVVLLVLLGPILFGFFVTVRRRRKPVTGSTGAEVSTSTEAIQRAQVASTVQDYRLALRMLYLASLLKLDEIGALRYDRALTNREYVRQVSLKPALADALWPVVETFDDVWYGFRPVTADGYGAFESKVNMLLRAAEAEKEGDRG